MKKKLLSSFLLGILATVFGEGCYGSDLPSDNLLPSIPTFLNVNPVPLSSSLDHKRSYGKAIKSSQGDADSPYHPGNEERPNKKRKTSNLVEGSKETYQANREQAFNERHFLEEEKSFDTHIKTLSFSPINGVENTIRENTLGVLSISPSFSVNSRTFTPSLLSSPYENNQEYLFLGSFRLPMQDEEKEIKITISELNNYFTRNKVERREYFYLGILKTSLDSYERYSSHPPFQDNLFRQFEERLTFVKQSFFGANLSIQTDILKICLGIHNIENQWVNIDLSLFQINNLYSREQISEQFNYFMMKALNLTYKTFSNNERLKHQGHTLLQKVNNIKRLFSSYLPYPFEETNSPTIDNTGPSFNIFPSSTALPLQPTSVRSAFKAVQPGLDRSFLFMNNKLGSIQEEEINPPEISTSTSSSLSSLPSFSPLQEEAASPLITDDELPLEISFPVEPISSIQKDPPKGANAPASSIVEALLELANTPSSEQDACVNIMAEKSKTRKGKKQTKKNKIQIPKEEIERYMNVSQPEAAEKLGISVSTLKRRYYEVFGTKRWPFNSGTSMKLKKERQQALEADKT